QAELIDQKDQKIIEQKGERQQKAHSRHHQKTDPSCHQLLLQSLPFLDLHPPDLVKATLKCHEGHCCTDQDPHYAHDLLPDRGIRDPHIGQHLVQFFRSSGTDRSAHLIHQAITHIG